VPVVTVCLVEGFLHLQSAPFQLDLHKRQSVHKQCHIIAVLIAALHRDLIGHLVLVLAPLRLIDQLDIARGPVIAGEVHLIAQHLGFLEDVPA